MKFVNFGIFLIYMFFFFLFFETLIIEIYHYIDALITGQTGR